MITKTISYTDYEGNDRTETFYFNLSMPELMQLEGSMEGGLSKYIEKISEKQDVSAMLKIFDTLILNSYGQKSPDGKRFIKSPEMAKEFSETAAYSKLFMEIASDPKAAEAFVNGVISSATEASKIAPRISAMPGA